MLTLEGQAAVDEAIADLARTSADARPSLALSPELSRASQALLEALCREGSQGALSLRSPLDGSMTEDRVRCIGAWRGLLCEVILCSNRTLGAQDLIEEACIGDGDKTRRHRRGLLSPEYTVCGVAVGTQEQSHPAFPTLAIVTLAGMLIPRSDLEEGLSQGMEQSRRIRATLVASTDDRNDEFFAVLRGIPIPEFVAQMEDEVARGSSVNIQLTGPCSGRVTVKRHKFSTEEYDLEWGSEESED
uniref:Uncharacterized protein n=1 Tax=Rhizochromulina marina TaxID=1034831 RepID=A0A7S2WGI1_9STRA